MLGIIERTQEFPDEYSGPDVAATVSADCAIRPGGSALSDCRSPAHLRNWLQRFARSFGFYGGRYMHIGHIPGGEGAERARPMRFLSTAVRDTADEAADHWLRGDPVAEVARTAFEPFTWNTRTHDALTEHQRAWLRSELARGIGAGIAIPVQDYASGPAYVSLFGVDEARGAGLLDQHAPEFAFTAAQFHVLAKVLLSTEEGGGFPAPALTRREIEVLRLAAMGWTVLDSAEALRIAGRTVEFHLSNACSKLNAVSKIHAVAIATTRRLISI